jgi:hypothetical protein
MPPATLLHRAHIAALALCAIMLPWSTAFLSMAQMLLAAVFLASGVVNGDLGDRFRRALTAPHGLVFLSIFLLHVLGLLWTTDLQWGSDLCRVLLPVAVLGVILGASEPLPEKDLRTVLLLGAWSAVASTIACLWSAPEGADYRAVSRFISHIRLALLLVFGGAVFVYTWGGPWWRRLAHAMAIAWCALFLGRLGSLQGAFIAMAIAAVWAWRAMAVRPAPWRIAFRSAIVVVPAVALAALLSFLLSGSVPGEGRPTGHERTAGGEVYAHDTTDLQRVGGRRVWHWVAWGELERTWARRSTLGFNDRDAKGHPVQGTLVRYLTSMGLRKDSVGVMSLTDDDVRRIEQGFAGVQEGRGFGLWQRLEEVRFELDRYRSTGDANGHSVTMRIEYLKAGWAIARANWPLGVGTGDTATEFALQYERMGTSLRPEWRHRAHNQYLTWWISFGVGGMLWCMFACWWPAWRLGRWRQPLFIAWAIAFGVSSLTDDTLETQAGATFFALYYTLLVFAAPPVTAPPAGPAPDRA